MKGFDWVKRASRKLSDQAGDLKDTLAENKSNHCCCLFVADSVAGLVLD